MTLKVVHLITQLELGGAQQNTLYTVAHLPRSRWEPILICGSGGLLDDEACQGAWETHVVKPLVRHIHPIRDVQAIFQIYRLLRTIKPAIVHTHSSKAGILGRLAAYVAGVPIIIHTFHGFGFTPGQPRWLHRLFVLIEKVCAWMSTHLIFVSDDNRQEARRLGIGRSVPQSVIHSGISLRTASPAGIRQECGIPDNAWIVACVGNFKPQKNPMDLIRTAKAVVSIDPSIHFVIAGDGPLRADVEAVTAQDNLTGHIHFLGWRRDTPEILAAADAYLLTSLWEGLPRSLVEAGAQSKPSVAYAVNGVQDLLKEGQNGFPIDPGNWQNAADKLLWLRGNPVAARKMGADARHAVEHDFDIDQMVEQQDILYTTLYNGVPLKETYGLPTL